MVKVTFGRKNLAFLGIPTPCFIKGVCKLQKLPGVGFLTASAIAASVDDPLEFKMLKTH